MNFSQPFCSKSRIKTGGCVKMNDIQTLTLTNDYLFKLLLGSEENKVCLQEINKNY